MIKNLNPFYSKILQALKLHFERTILALVVLFFCNNVTSQTNELKAYTVEDGLPQSQVYAIAQDSIGYLWLGTQGGGLARFDGENFEVFNEKSGLGSSYVNALASINNDVLIGTRKGVSIFSGRNFKNFNTPAVRQIRVINNKIYFATIQGIFTLTNTGEVQQCVLSDAINNASVNDIVFKNDNYWIATKEGLYKTQSLLKRKPVSQIANGNFTSITTTIDQIFAATFNDGIRQYNVDGTPLNTSDIPRRINSIEILDNKLWVATDTKGLFVLNPNTFEIEATISDRQGLSVRHVRSVFKDTNGQLWIATSGGGLIKYFPNQFTHYDKDTGLIGNRIYAVESTKDRVWFSVEEQGLSYIDSLGIKRSPPISEFDNVKIKTLASDASGSIWAGSEGKGLLYKHIRKYDSIVVSGSSIATIKLDTIKIEKVTDYVLNEKVGFPSNWIRSIYVDGKDVWAATYGDGIVKFNYDTKRKRINIIKHFGKEQGIDDMLIRDLKPDEQGRIWYGTQAGAIGFIDNNNVTHLGNILGVNTSINTLVFKNNTLYIGTADSGIFYSTDNDYKNFKPLTGDKTPTSKNSYLLIFDSENNLWTGSERGIDKLVLNSENEIIDLFHYGRTDGFLGIETCLNAVAEDENNTLWFGAIYGLTAFENNLENKDVQTKPTIHFESIDIGYKSLDSLLKLDAKNKVLNLEPNENQLSFTYRTVDLNHPKGVQYRYKIDNTKWSPWSTTAQQNFAGLAYGKHIFSAQSRNYRWIESEPIEFKFNIGTPLFQQAWFQWLLIACSLLVLFIIVYAYVRNLKKKNRTKQAQLELENHLLGLEQKALRLQMNPHFIFNVLNGIKAMGVTDTKKMNTTINSFATLLRGILNNSRKEQITLAEEINVLKNYIEVEQLMAQKPFKYSLQIESDLDPEEVLIPPMLVQPFVENAIKHGISSSNQINGNLEILFKTTQTYLTCSITDNGKGIFESQKNKPTTSHQSVALGVTKERIESLSGKGALSISEIKENTIIKGTRIHFKIPLETEF